MPTATTTTSSEDHDLSDHDNNDNPDDEGNAKDDSDKYSLPPKEHDGENQESATVTADLEEAVDISEKQPRSDDNEQQEEETTTTTTRTRTKMQALEIDDNNDDDDFDKELDRLCQEDHDEENQAMDDNEDQLALNRTLSEDDDLTDDDDDMEGLLDNDKTSKTSKQKGKTKKHNNSKQPKQSTKIAFACGACCSAHKIGNTTVFWPSQYQKTGWGMMGPHIWGPPAVLAILWSASYHFIRQAFLYVGWMTGSICIVFSATATYQFVQTAFRDPGIVRPSDNLGQRPPPPSRHHRWCDLCQAYQPPDGAHCPHCNVCVAGYDHHCAWMGCCIGAGNHKHFVRFNMTWLVFLSYSIFWVSALGPLLFRHHSHHDDDEMLGGGDEMGLDNNLPPEEQPGPGSDHSS